MRDAGCVQLHTTTVLWLLSPPYMACIMSVLAYLLLPLCLVLLSAVIKQFLVHLHEEFEGIVDETMDCSEINGMVF